MRAMSCCSSTRRLDPRGYLDQARSLLEVAGLGDPMPSYPRELAGGMKQLAVPRFTLNAGVTP